MPISPTVSFVAVGPRCIGRSKTEVEVFSGWSSPGQVCLSLERGFVAQINKARLGMRFGFRCLFFHLFGLLSHEISFALRAGGLFRTFAEAARHMYQ